MTIKFYDREGSWLFSYHNVIRIVEDARHLLLIFNGNTYETIKKNQYWNFEIWNHEVED